MFDWFYFVSLVAITNVHIEERGYEGAIRHLHAMLSAFFVVYCGGETSIYGIRVFVKMVAYWFYLMFSMKHPTRLADLEFYIMTIICILMAKQVVVATILSVEMMRSAMCDVFGLKSILKCSMTLDDVRDIIMTIISCATSLTRLDKAMKCVVFEAAPIECMFNITK